MFRNITMPSNYPSSLSKSRLIILLSLLCILSIGVIWRLIYINTKDYDFLKNEGEKRTHRIHEQHGYRGSIVDRNGYPLAVSTPVNSIWVDPRYLELNSGLSYVFQLLGLSETQQDKILKRIQPKLGHSGFVYLKRQVDPSIAQKIDDLNLPGIYLEKEYKRFYPDGEVVAHVVGFTNIDEEGQEGIELQYNNWLSGKSDREIDEKT